MHCIVGTWLLLVVTALDLRELRPRKRAVALVLIRTLVLGLVYVMLLEPAVELRDVEREKNHVVFLVDGSESMSVAADASATRRDRVNSILDHLGELWRAESEDHVFDFYLFGTEAQRSSPAAVPACRACRVC